MWIREFISDRDNHLSAAQEVIVVSVLSLVPLFLLPLVELRLHPLQFRLDTLWKAIDSGQLFLYSFGIFGMLMWLLGVSRKKNTARCL
jgi:hypothetical protein